MAMIPTTTFNDVQRLESRLVAAKSSYLTRFGWLHTSQTPGSMWLWARDFLDVDTRREERMVELNARLPEGTEKFVVSKYGRITVDTETAIYMTRSCLDQAHMTRTCLDQTPGGLET